VVIELFEHQKDALEKLKTGSILCGGVGSGKSRTGVAYYFIKECSGKIRINDNGNYSPMKNPKDLYIITTAKKRDSLEWEKECLPFLLSTKKQIGDPGLVIDSWNIIAKYKHVKNAFFIFDEQRVGGSGKWVKNYLYICRNNNWILLSATPGDTWMDYIPVFIANGFYKNRTEFIHRHVVYNTFTKYPKINHYVEVGRLVRLREQVIIHMRFKRQTISHNKAIITDFDKDLFNIAMVDRWNPYEQKPIKDVSELCYILRRIVNSDKARIEAVKKLTHDHSRLIIFYNFNYELDLLLELGKELNIPTTQWNGHKHEEIPNTEDWIYLVQYSAGAEGWNCIETDAMIFYSQSYSYKATVQAAGRIDRLNTPFRDLYYYHLRSMSIIDLSIYKTLKNKKNFNESCFISV